MKKKINKIFGLLMTLAILLSSLGANHVYAAGNGTITVNGTTVGKTYGIYKIFDLTHQGENVSYTIASEWGNFFENGDGKDYIVDTDPSGKLNPIVVNGEVKYINITEDNVAEFAKAAMGQMHNKTKAGVQEASKDSIIFNNLDLGYYLVHPEGATETAENQTSIVSLTSTTPNGQVLVKGKYPTIKKEADKKSADYGQTITFTIKGKVPDTTGYSVYGYVLKDTLPTGLTYTPNKMTVKIGNADVKDKVITLIENQNITVRFNILDLMKDSGVKAGDEILVTYETTVNKDFVLGNGGQENKAHVEFSNDPKNTESKDKTPEEKVKVYSGKIEVIKHDAKSEDTKLAGAKFVLYKKVNDTPKYYKLTEENETKVVSWVDNIDDATVMTSDTSGQLAFTGLAAGKYFLKETVAPDGYNLLTKDTEVVLSDDDSSAEALKMEATPKIENKSGVELPGTGGAGTTLFALIGGCVILYAAFALLRGKFKAQER
ncbi:MAG: SpaH/EbpB family LPXTG-anchored major pilin [Lagierella massiliensis]|nr:SpaH/EbpB family LPXTG-anchored major pilin [Lagierella massiliensis]